jgi:hypothetical protein
MSWFGDDGDKDGDGEGCESEGDEEEEQEQVDSKSHMVSDSGSVYCTELGSDYDQGLSSPRVRYRLMGRPSNLRYSYLTSNGIPHSHLHSQLQWKMI